MLDQAGKASLCRSVLVVRDLSKGDGMASISQANTGLALVMSTLAALSLDRHW